MLIITGFCSSIFNYKFYKTNSQYMKLIIPSIYNYSYEVSNSYWIMYSFLMQLPFFTKNFFNFHFHCHHLFPQSNKNPSLPLTCYLKMELPSAHVLLFFSDKLRYSASFFYFKKLGRMIINYNTYIPPLVRINNAPSNANKEIESPSWSWCNSSITSAQHFYR